ncbi:hypothetical protein L218DRAFT_491707 [Marasmius fiardii PR-910]|nr:hypothetical protein L218DRAFT_491707 [Marasmius fiardii PR-910]
MEETARSVPITGLGDIPELVLEIVKTVEGVHANKAGLQHLAKQSSTLAAFIVNKNMIQPRISLHFWYLKSLQVLDCWRSFAISVEWQPLAMQLTDLYSPRPIENSIKTISKCFSAAAPKLPRG